MKILSFGFHGKERERENKMTTATKTHCVSIGNLLIDSNTKLMTVETVCAKRVWIGTAIAKNWKWESFNPNVVCPNCKERLEKNED